LVILESASAGFPKEITAIIEKIVLCIINLIIFDDAIST
jgi:hypothetical protein